MFWTENVPNVACVRDIESAKNTLSPYSSLRVRVSHVGHVCRERTICPVRPRNQRPYGTVASPSLFQRAA